MKKEQLIKWIKRLGYICLFIIPIMFLIFLITRIDIEIVYQSCQNTKIINKLFQPATGDCVSMNRCSRYGTQDWYFIYFTGLRTIKSQINYNIGDEICIYEEN